MDKKVCPKCGHGKSLQDDFTRDSSSPDGRSCWCKTCTRAACTARYKADPEKYKRKFVPTSNLRVCNRPGCTNILPPNRKSPKCRECHGKATRASNEKNLAYPANVRARAKRYYWEDPGKHRGRAKQDRAKLRRELIQAYGGKCTCCGEAEPAFLTIEHKNRDGAAHRKRLSGSQSCGYAVYVDLKRRGWPQEDYTLLCFNCNHAMWKLGVCPHMRKDGHDGTDTH